MVVELKSLLPMLQESFEKLTEETASLPPVESVSAEVPKTGTERGEQAAVFQLPEGESASPDSRLADLLEQLLAVTGKNADSFQRIADLLEQREQEQKLTFN